MTRKRRSLPVDVKRLVLDEAGYKCGNPACHSILMLDIHHLEKVSDNGENSLCSHLCLSLVRFGLANPYGIALR